MIDKIIKGIANSEPFLQLAASMKSIQPGSPVQLQGINGSLTAFAAVHLFELSKTQMLIVAADRDRAERLCDDCATLLDGGQVCLYVVGPCMVQ